MNTITIRSTTPFVYSDFDSPTRDASGYLALPADEIRIALKRAGKRLYDVHISVTNARELVSTEGGFQIDKWQVLLVTDAPIEVVRRAGERGIGAWVKRGFGRFEVKE